MQEKAGQKKTNENIQVNPQVQPVNNKPVYNPAFKRMIVWGVVLVAFWMMFNVFTHSSKNNGDNTAKSGTTTESASKEDDTSNDIKAYGDYLQSFSFDDKTITALRSSDGDNKLTEDDYKYFAIMKDIAKEISDITLDYDVENGDCTIMEESLKDGSRQFVHARMTATNESGTKYNTNARFELTKDGKLVLHSLKADDSNLNYDDGTMLNGTHSK